MRKWRNLDPNKIVEWLKIGNGENNKENQNQHCEDENHREKKDEIGEKNDDRKTSQDQKEIVSHPLIFVTMSWWNIWRT